MNRSYKSIFVTVFILMFSFLVLVSLGNAGLIKHDIYSPFNVWVDGSEATYPSSIQRDPTTSVIDNIYKDFEEYPASLAGHEGDDEYNLGEPFCMIGGQYMVKVHNDPTPGAAVQDWDMKMYYCKTTYDLLERVKIPASWVGADLLVYCNDGANINANSTNYDYITNSMNTYKACIIRNLNLDTSNTLVYGYDVGNKIVDNAAAYFYNTTTHTGPILKDPSLVYLTITGQTTGTSSAYMGQYQVPYNSSNLPRGDVDAKAYLISEFSLGTDIEVSHVNDVPADSYSIYSVRQPYQYLVEEYLFNYTKLNTTYFFGYDANDKFYYMKDFDEALSVPILDVFIDADIGLSRVVLFKKLGTKYIYGYEVVSNNPSISTELPYNQSVKPVYKIELSNNFGLSSQVCVDSLKKYEPMYVIAANTGVMCSTNEISIVALNVDLNENDNKYAFHLFKNIVTSLE